MIPWTVARQASLSITNSLSLLKLMSIESVMPPTHLVLCYPLLLLSSVFPSIRVFSNGSVHQVDKVLELILNSGLISFRIDWFDILQSKGLSRVFSNTTVQKHEFFGTQLTL